MANQADFKVKKGLQVAGGDINLGNAQNAVIQVDEVSGSNTAGKSLTISAGEGTGTGAGGDIIFQTANAGNTGSSPNPLATALTISDDLSAAFTGAVTLGNATGDDITVTGRLASDLIPKTGSSYDLGSSTLQFAEAHIDTGHIDALTVTGTSTLTTVDINGGAVDGTTVGAASASTGAFTTLSATGTSTLTTVDINGGAVDGTTVGASSASTGAFTTLAASGAVTVGSDGSGADVTFHSDTAGDNMLWDASEEQLKITGTSGQVALDIDTGNFTVGAYGLTDAGAATIASMAGNWTNAGRTVADAGTLTTVDINGGSIDGAVIGAASAAAGTFTSLSVSDGAITNVSQISLDAIAPDATDIQIKISNGSATALDIIQGSDSYMKFDTNAAGIVVGVPLFTIGDGTAEDTKLIFDGNEVDFRLGIDDSANEFEIGPGAAHDTTPAIVIDNNGHVTRIGQSSAGANKYLKWDNSNSRAVWDTVSGAASSVAADDIGGGDGSIDLETSTGGVNVSTDAVNQTLTLGNTSGPTVINGLTLDVNSAGVSTLDATTSHTITTPVTSITSSTRTAIDTPIFTVTSSTSASPAFTIENTNADGNGPVLKLSKNGASVADEDLVGTITFASEDDGSAAQTYGSIVTSIVDASADAEEGKMVFNVAEYDGTVTQGLALEGGSANGVINVTLGAGTASTTTVAGNLTVSGTTTTVSSTTLEVTDDLITVSKGNDTVANADGSGMEIDATGATNLYWKYVHANTAWTSNVDIDTATTSDVYKIAGTNVLTNNTLGSGVVTSSLTSVGALNSGSITSGFTSIDVGAGAISTTGLITGGSLDIDDVVINGTTIGHTNDTDLLTVANGSLTLAGSLNQESTALMDAYSATLATTSATTMFTLASNAYSAGKVLVSVWREDSSSDDHRSVTEFLFTYQGASTPSASSNIHMTEYALVDTSGSQLATFDVVKDSGNILVQITPASSDQTKVRAQITQLVI